MWRCNLFPFRIAVVNVFSKFYAFYAKIFSMKVATVGWCSGNVLRALNLYTI